MKEWKWVCFIFLVSLVVVVGSELAGHREYVVNLARVDGLQTFYLLIGAGLCLVLRDPGEKHGKMALASAVAAVFCSMFLSAFDNLENDLLWNVAVALTALFLTTLIFSVMHLFNALNASEKRMQQDKPRPRFARTPPPRRW